MTLPDVSGSLGPLSPGTNGTLWAVGPRVVRYQIPALAYLTPGALWTLRTRGTSLTSGPIGTRDSIRTLHAVHYDVWTLGPLGPLGPTSPRGPSARPCRLQTDSLHSTDARCYRCKMLQMQDATDARCKKDMSPFSFPGILEPSHLVGSLKSPRVDPGVPCRPLALWGHPYQCLRLVPLYQRCLHPHCFPAAPGRPWDPWCRPDRLDP
ncbi:hypothetical protein [Terrapene mexicana triunguis ranavirus 1]|uniref:Uncharacterized protein 036L n=1 Tax=Frog virus 3 (isolate Goorha) TaxID=654924 RepID=036L_FRG3G|nr:hypothetical protein FV3gorf36L [Frog virus 3]Q6GZU0.1 RecName: Full=Uncharacterized protein 036L [Frog virus 3 (isolate Goorha)]AAT09695.1 unknown [Frog virus 3]WBG67499.1 hypothetical protein [Terrapene mexicana triunguis ranavirus 1]